MILAQLKSGKFQAPKTKSGGPTYLPAIFALSAKPNKMAENRTIPARVNCIGQNLPTGSAS